MNSIIQAALLGLVQGLTEFLPVSSSGHLAIFKNIFGDSMFEYTLTFDILLHLGTLLAVFAVYYKDVIQLITEFFTMIGDLFKGKPNFKTPYRRMIIMLILGTIPAVFMGLLIKDFVEDIPGKYLYVVGIGLFVTAFLLYISEKLNKDKYTMENVPTSTSWVVGLFQAVAIFPGISRSGSTIVGSLVSGYKKEFAVKFSFLLSIPAILGAAVLDFKDVFEAGAFNIPIINAIVGVAVAAVSGFIAIKFLLKLVQNSKLYLFSYYCVAAGIFTIIISIIK